MIYLPVSQLEPTMVVAATVPHPNRACNDLLRPGYHLSEKTIERLAELNVPGVWVQYPPLEQLDSRLIDRIPSINQKLYLTFRDSFDRTAKPTTLNFDLQTYRQTVIELVLAMFEEGRHNTLLGRLFDSGEPFVDHCLNVCFVSLVLGINAQHYLIQERAALPAHLAADTTNLGLGAIFHDVGKIVDETQDLLRHNILYAEPDDAAAVHQHVLRGVLGIDHLGDSVEHLAGFRPQRGLSRPEQDLAGQGDHRPAGDSRPAFGNPRLSRLQLGNLLPAQFPGIRHAHNFQLVRALLRCQRVCRSYNQRNAQQERGCEP